MAHRESTKARYLRQEALRRLILESATDDWRAKHGDNTFRAAEGLADLLLRRASRHHTLCEHACNRELSSREERETEAIERNVTADLAEVNPAIVVEPTGDPRGYTIKLHFPPINGRKPYNTWGGEETGFGI